MTTSSDTIQAAGVWTIDPAHSHIEFGVRHMMISTVKGRFAEVEGKVDASDPEHPDVEVTIPVASIDTRQEQRDAHLRSPDFFDAEQHPAIHFASTGVEGDPTSDKFQLTGNLTIRGVTHPITLDVTAEGTAKDPWGGERAGYSARGKINRKDYNLTWNQALETGGVLVGEEIKISIDVELVKEQGTEQ